MCYKKKKKKSCLKTSYSPHNAADTQSGWVIDDLHQLMSRKWQSDQLLSVRVLLLLCVYLKDLSSLDFHCLIQSFVVNYHTLHLYKDILLHRCRSVGLLRVIIKSSSQSAKPLFGALIWYSWTHTHTLVTLAFSSPSFVNTHLKELSFIASLLT